MDAVTKKLNTEVNNPRDTVLRPTCHFPIWNDQTATIWCRGDDGDWIAEHRQVADGEFDEPELYDIPIVVPAVVKVLLTAGEAWSVWSYGPNGYLESRDDIEPDQEFEADRVAATYRASIDGEFPIGV